MEASGAAACAEGLLASRRGTLTRAEELPLESDIRGIGPRTGVFVCHCGINIGGVVDVPAVVEYAKTLPNVVFATDNLFTCSQDTAVKMGEVIKEHNLTRVVVASCSPRTHEGLFQENCEKAGLNRYLFEMANIRDQNSWVHMHEPEAATEKAKDLVRMAIAKAEYLKPLKPGQLSVNHAVLIIGGGLAGITAALSLADQGFESHHRREGVRTRRQLPAALLHPRRPRHEEAPGRSCCERVGRQPAHPCLHRRGDQKDRGLHRQLQDHGRRQGKARRPSSTAS